MGEDLGLQQAVSSNIQIARVRKHWEQKDLADRLGVTAKKVSEWESGRNLIRLDTLVEIARALGVSLDYLVAGDEGIDERLAALDAKWDRRLTDLGRQIEAALGDRPEK